MPALKQRLENGLDPDIKFMGGRTILHLIALKGEHAFLEDKQYQPVVEQLWLSGADLDAKNDSGHTILDVLGSNQGWSLGDTVNAIKTRDKIVSFKQEALDSHLTTFSLQKEPTAKGKRWIIDLIKGGANPDVMTANGKRISENIRENWSSENSKAFTDIVVAAKFKSAANGQEKMPHKTYINDKWNNAVLAFFKAGGHDQQSEKPHMSM